MSSDKPKPDRVTGVAHFFAAGSYSIAGIKRLWAETAFRHEFLAFVAAVGLLVFIGAAVSDYAILLVLFFILVAVEALNTAMEVIVDHLAPNWAEFARDAKDLGSLAVMCILLASGVFLASVVARTLFGLGP